MDFDIMTAAEYNNKYYLGQPHIRPALIRCNDNMLCIAKGISRQYIHKDGCIESYLFTPSLNAFAPSWNEYKTQAEQFIKLWSVF